MPTEASDVSEWTTVKRRRETHKRDAGNESHPGKTNGLKPLNTTVAGKQGTRSKYEDATESSTNASTMASRSVSPSSAGTGRDDELTGGRRKARKQKTVITQLHIDADEFYSKVAAAEERYADDALVQLQCVTDSLVTHFRGIDLPFNKLVMEQSLEKVSAASIR
jgi:hypothetical protein